MAMLERPLRLRARLLVGLCLLCWVALLGDPALVHARIHARPLHTRHGAHHASVPDDAADDVEAPSRPDRDEAATEVLQGTAADDVTDEWSNAPDFGDPSAPRNAGTSEDTPEEQEEEASAADPAEARADPAEARADPAEARADPAEARGGLASTAAGESDEACEAKPFVDDAWLSSPESQLVGPHTCFNLGRTCLDQSAYILYEPQYYPTNQTFPTMPKLDMSTYWALWKGLYDEPTQHLGGLRQYAEPLFRPPLRGDQKQPSFSNCTVPVVLYKSHDTNFGHVTISTLPQIYSFYKQGAVNQDVTYVVGTLHNLPVSQFLVDWMKPFSKYPVESLADFTSRLPPNFPSNATGEGRHVRCFSKVVVCQIWDLFVRGIPRDVAQAGKYVYDWYAEHNLLPDNPAGFSKLGTNPKKPIRVLVVERESTRAILNIAELVDDCNADAGPWECRRAHLGGGLARDMELVHSADVMVGAHGAGLKNYIFMRADTAFIELIPQGFYRLREGHEWSLFIPATTQAMDNVVRHYAINVEDPAMSDPSSFEKEGWVWTSVFGPPHKERNMRLPWTMLKQVLDVIRTSDRDAYLRLRRDGDNVFDLLPGGVLQRTPVPNECYGIKRLDEGKDLGKQALDSIEQLQEDSTNTREVFQRALELATNGVLGTQDAVNVLNNRKDGGAKTNETLIELLVAQNAQNKQILSTVENAIRKAGLTELLPQSPPPPGQEAGALSA